MDFIVIYNFLGCEIQRERVEQNETFANAMLRLINKYQVDFQAGDRIEFVEANGDPDQRTVL